MTYLLDTHVWIWWHMRPERLSDTVKSLLGNPQSTDGLLLSAISPWEFCKLVAKGQLGITGDTEEWLTIALEMHGLDLVPLTPRIAYKSTVLPPPFHSDPADQIIVATARETGAILLTADRLISEYHGVSTLW